MLREEWEVSALDVLVRATEQADLFADAAHHLAAHGRDEAVALCNEMAAHRRRLAADMEAALRTHDIYPKSMDPEREAADRLFANVKSALSADEVDSLLHTRLHSDEHLRRSVAEAQSVEGMPDDLARLFAQYAQSLSGDDVKIDAFLAGRHKTA